MTFNVAFVSAIEYTFEMVSISKWGGTRICTVPENLKRVLYPDCQDLSFKRALMGSREDIASHTPGNKSSEYESMTERKGE